MELGKGYVLPEAGALIGGRFRVARVVGSGGIAAVLEAADEQAQGTRVAIKLLKPHVVDDASQRVRFQREADAMARLKHPNIVEIIFNGFSDPEYPFLAMEYLDRGSLGGQIDERRNQHDAEDQEGDEDRDQQQRRPHRFAEEVLPHQSEVVHAASSCSLKWPLSR